MKPAADFPILNRETICELKAFLEKAAPRVLYHAGIRNPEDRDDIIQIALCKLLRQEGKQLDEQPEQYAFMVLRNAAIDFGRREGRSRTQIKNEAYGLQQWRQLSDFWNRQSLASDTVVRRAEAVFDSYLRAVGTETAKSVQIVRALGSIKDAALHQAPADVSPRAMARIRQNLRHYQSDHLSKVRKLREENRLLPFLLEVVARERNSISVAPLLNAKITATDWGAFEKTVRTQGSCFMHASGYDESLQVSREILFELDKMLTHRVFATPLRRTHLTTKDVLSLIRSVVALIDSFAYCKVGSRIPEPGFVYYGTKRWHESHKGVSHVPEIEADIQYARGLTLIEMGADDEGETLLARLSNQMIEQLLDTGTLVEPNFILENPQPQQAVEGS